MNTEREPNALLETLRKRENDLYAILSHYGLTHQILKLIEECGELQMASARILLKESEDSDNFIEEIGDVLILIFQIVDNSIFTDKLVESIKYKIDRTLKRMNEESYIGGKDDRL